MTAANLGSGEAARGDRDPASAGTRGPIVEWTQRARQKRSQVRLGLVNKVIRHLCDEAFVSEDMARGDSLTELLKFFINLI